MRDTHYNQLAGRSLERLFSLSDNVFGVSMTLLVLNLRVPEIAAIHNEHDLWHAIGLLLPSLLPYVMSFITLGIFWNGQQAQLNYFARSDRNLTWIQLAFLFIVTLVPFTTMLLSEFLIYRSALFIYWLNLMLLGIMLYLSLVYGMRAGLIKKDAPPELAAVVKTRVYVSQTLYAFGMLLCLFNNMLSIGFIFIVQLNYAFAPRFTAFIHQPGSEKLPE